MNLIISLISIASCTFELNTQNKDQNKNIETKKVTPVSGNPITIGGNENIDPSTLLSKALGQITFARGDSVLSFRMKLIDTDFQSKSPEAKNLDKFSILKGRVKVNTKEIPVVIPKDLFRDDFTYDLNISGLEAV